MTFASLCSQTSPYVTSPVTPIQLQLRKAPFCPPVHAGPWPLALCVPCSCRLCFGLQFASLSLPDPVSPHSLLACSPTPLGPRATALQLSVVLARGLSCKGLRLLRQGLVASPTCPFSAPARHWSPLLAVAEKLNKAGYFGRGTAAGWGRRPAHWRDRGNRRQAVGLRAGGCSLAGSCQLCQHESC